MRRRIATILAPATLAGALMFGVSLTGTSDHQDSAVADLPPAVEVETVTTEQAQETTETVTVEAKQEPAPVETATEAVQETTETAAGEQEQESAVSEAVQETAEQEQDAPLMVSEEQVGQVSEELPWDAPSPCHWVGLTVEQCEEFANPAPGTVSVIIVYGTTFEQVEEVLIWQNGELLDIDYQHVDKRPEW